MVIRYVPEVEHEVRDEQVRANVLLMSYRETIADGAPNRHVHQKKVQHQDQLIIEMVKIQLKLWSIYNKLCAGCFVH